VGPHDLIIEFDTLGLDKTLKQFDALIAKVQQLQNQINQRRPPNAGGSRGGGFGMLDNIFSSLGISEWRYPIQAAVMAVVGLGLALGKLTETVISTAKEFAHLALTTGGTPGQAGGISGIGTALGIRDSEIEAMARAMNENMKTGPGISAAASVGVMPDFNDFHVKNSAKQLMDVVQGLRKLDAEGGRSKAVFAAMQLGVEGLLGYLNLTDATVKAIAHDGAITNAVMQQFGRAGLEFSVSIDRLGKSLLDLATVVIGPMLPRFTEFVDGLTQMFQIITIGLMRMRPVFAMIGDMIEAVMDIDTYQWPSAIKALKRAMGEFSEEKWKQADKDALKAAQDMNTAAINANSQITGDLNQTLKQGTMGGGDRARGALPGGWNSGNQQNFQHAMRLGAM